MPARLPALPDEHRNALAEVALRSSQLDHMVEWAVSGALFDTARTSRYVLANVSGERIENLLRALLTDRFPDEEANINVMVNRIREYRRERNELLHWLWDETEDQGEMRLLEIRPHRDERTKPKTAAEIMKLADAMGEVSDDLARWASRAAQAILESLRERHELRALRERSPSPSVKIEK
jgi:hypothetical protein